MLCLKWLGVLLVLVLVLLRVLHFEWNGMEWSEGGRKEREDERAKEWAGFGTWDLGLGT